MPTPPTWGVPIRTEMGPGNRIAYLAQYPGAPRFQIWIGGRQTHDGYAFSSSDRVSLNGRWGDDGRLYLMAGAAGKTWLGQPILGAPRLQIFTDHGQLVFDDFMADNTRRESWVPVPVTLHPPVMETGGGFQVFLSFEGRRGPDYYRAAFNEAARLLVPLGFRLTTARPKGPASRYGQIIFDCPQVPELYEGFMPGPLWNAPIGAEWEARCVYITPQPIPDYAGMVAAHETGHAFGVQHRMDKSVMSEKGRTRPYWFHPDDAAAIKRGVTVAQQRR